MLGGGVSAAAAAGATWNVLEWRPARESAAWDAPAARLEAGAGGKDYKSQLGRAVGSRATNKRSSASDGAANQCSQQRIDHRVCVCLASLSTGGRTQLGAPRNGAEIEWASPAAS